MTGVAPTSRISLFAPAAWLGAYAVVIWSNASDIATDRYGLPPIGMGMLLALTRQRPRVEMESMGAARTAHGFA